MGAGPLEWHCEAVEFGSGFFEGFEVFLRGVEEFVAEPGLAGKGEEHDGLAHEGFVGVEVLARGFKIAVAHQLLYRHDVAS